jgi:hypothetical protein
MEEHESGSDGYSSAGSAWDRESHDAMEAHLILCTVYKGMGREDLDDRKRVCKRVEHFARWYTPEYPWSVVIRDGDICANMHAPLFRAIAEAVSPGQVQGWKQRRAGYRSETKVFSWTGGDPGVEFNIYSDFLGGAGDGRWILRCIFVGESASERDTESDSIEDHSDWG